MSTLTECDKAKIEKIFQMKNGGVLGFHSKSELRQFILLETKNIDIEANEYSNFNSRAKKFRYFLDNESDFVVAHVLLKMLEKREKIMKQKGECLDDFKDEFEVYASDIKNIALLMSSECPFSSSNQERLNMDINVAQEVLYGLVDIAKKICANASYNYKSLENNINDYFRDMLKIKNKYEVYDQTRHGNSLHGKDAGEVDLLLKKVDKEIALIEALKLNCLDQDYLHDHIEKALMDYNPHGSPTFIMIYSGAAKFADFWDKLYDYLMQYNFFENIKVKKPLENLTSVSAAIKCANMIVSKGDFDFPVYFIMINLGR